MGTAKLETAATAKTEEHKQKKDARAREDSTETKERQASVDRKVTTARQETAMKLYIIDQLRTAHETRSTVGDGVQQQVKKIATATKNVAETLHYVHQNRVDGLNDGVSNKFHVTEKAFDSKCQEIKDDMKAQNTLTTAAIDRNNVRTHALAQDIVDRHGLTQFRKHKVATTFHKVAGTEAEESKPGNWQDQSYYTKQATPKAYAAEKFPVQVSAESKSRRRLANQPKSHTTVLEALLEEINRLN